MGQNASRCHASRNRNQHLESSHHRFTSSLFHRVIRRQNHNFRKPSHLENFVDLDLLPPEVAIEVLKNLNATDLCLAACVWSDLANDEFLWESLCKSSWKFCSAYDGWKKQGKSFKRLFLLLDEGSLTFNTEPEWGIQYLVENGVLENSGKHIAKFFHQTNQLCWQQVRIYLKTRLDVLEELIELQNYKNQFLPNALRAFFHAVHAPQAQADSLNFLLDKFSRQFCRDNPNEHLTPEIVVILCYSLLLLSVDLTSPKIKNKMSKREFVKNICHAVQMQGNNVRNQVQQLPNHNNLQNQERNIVTTMDRDFAGHLYDNVYLLGHVAPERWEENRS